MGGLPKWQCSLASIASGSAALLDFKCPPQAAGRAEPKSLELLPATLLEKAFVHKSTGLHNFRGTGLRHRKRGTVLQLSEFTLWSNFTLASSHCGAISHCGASETGHASS